MRLAGWKRRALLAAVLLAAAAAAGLPWVELPMLAAPLKSALSRALGRPVELSGVHCTLLPAPSLLAENVVIGEDPAFGLEPFVYADEMRASIRLAALARGALEVGSVRLAGASLNVVRDEKAGFNVAAFLQKAFSSASATQAIPDLILKQSRLNFRSGALKSPYYLNEVELDLQPPRRPGEELRWRYEASPARTDRAEQGFGRFTGAGRWIPGAGGGRFAVDVSLERSAVQELLVLLTGRDLGLQGRFVAGAFLDGPFHALELRGNLEVLDLERQTLFDFRSKNMQLPFQGVLDLDHQTVQISSAPPQRGRPAAPLHVRLEGQGLLTTPSWRAEVDFQDVPAGGLLEVCRRLGIPSPSSLRVEGLVSGSAGFSTGQAARGRLLAPKVRLTFGDGPAVEAEEAALRLEGDLLMLESARITSPQTAQASVTGSWNWAEDRLGFELRTDGMEVGAMNEALKRLAAFGSVPFFEHCGSGIWRGRLAFTKAPGAGEDGAAAAWTGQAALSNARCAPPWLPASLHLRKALLEPAGPGWRLRQGEAQFGHVPVRVEARYEPKEKPPMRVSLRVGRLTGEDLEAVFHLGRPPRRSLLDRTLRRRAAMPPWLRQLDLGGSFEAESLVLGRQEFEDLEAQFHWRRGQIRFQRVSAKWKGAAVSGAGEAELWREEPRYRARAVVTGLTAGTGLIDAEVEASTSTLGAGLPEKAHGWAEVSSPLLRLGAGGIARQLHVSLEYDGARGQQPWRLPEISFWMEGQFWSGRGTASSDGTVRAEFPSPGIHWEGAFWPPSAPRAAH